MTDLVGVVHSGDRRASLEAIRDRLAAEMAGVETSARDVATLAKQLQDVMRELDSLPSAGVVSPVDEITARRDARRSAAQVPERPAAGERGRSGGSRPRGKRGSAP